MRRAFWVMLFVGVLPGPFQALQSAAAMPALLRQETGSEGLFQRVEDTCWWWATRWQYGWNGYGWYPCWDWVKPQPTVVAPEMVPEDALEPQPCVKRWRDPSGLWHARRVC